MAMLNKRVQEKITLTPIGYLHCKQSEKYMAPRQAGVGLANAAVVALNPGSNFEQALEDLKGFERIWLIYWMDRNQTWKPKVSPPRPGPKRGVFATRSPHRPNPIGLSCVELLEIKGRALYIGSHDLLDGTPILDIKPYLCYADAFPESKQGWVDSVPELNYQVQWSALASEQAQFIEQHCAFPLVETVTLRLRENPFPFAGRRIRAIDTHTYLLAFKTWRILYRVDDHNILIVSITTGYDQETLKGKKTSRWDDVPIHQLFLQCFQ